MDEVIDVQEKYAQLLKARFFDHILFSYQWWILVLTTVGLWVIWMMLVDKKRLKALLIVGFGTSMLAVVMDDVGLTVAAWSYPYQLIYSTSRLNPVDLSIIPVAYMLLYQYIKTWKVYLPVLAAFCLFGAFIAEPLFVHLDMYVMLRWKYWYSALIYLAMGIFIKWSVDKLDKSAEQ